MNTFIISAKNKDLTTKQIDKLNKENDVDKFDIEYYQTEKALGIEDVRKIQEKISLKPFKGERKSIIIDLYLGISIEAQNSMLKLLEEPPKSSVIILIVDSLGNILPTILSRGKVIEIKSDNIESSDEIDKIDSINQGFLYAQNLSKDKNEAIMWLEKAILYLRENMLNNLDNREKSLKYRKMIHQVELTHYELKNTNINARLSLENLFLNL